MVAPLKMAPAGGLGGCLCKNIIINNFNTSSSCFICLLIMRQFGIASGGRLVVFFQHSESILLLELVTYIRANMSCIDKIEYHFQTWMVGPFMSFPSLSQCKLQSSSHHEKQRHSRPKGRSANRQGQWDGKPPES